MVRLVCLASASCTWPHLVPAPSCLLTDIVALCLVRLLPAGAVCKAA
eukprot:SAG22_NODE_1982_length_3207_cov_2.771557_2_plen_47_part_00